MKLQLLLSYTSQELRSAKEEFEIMKQQKEDWGRMSHCLSLARFVVYDYCEWKCSDTYSATCTYMGLSFFKVSSLCRAGMFDLGEAYPEAYPRSIP